MFPYMMEYKHKQILDFIKHFQNEGTISTFMEGCCYWFAHILKARFVLGKIVYEPIIGHFLYQLEDKCYDIRGLINTEDMHLEEWDNYEINSAHRKRIHNDCILKLEEYGQL